MCHGAACRCTIPLGNVDLTSEFNDLDPKNNNKTDVFYVPCWAGICVYFSREFSTGYVYFYHCCGVAFTESVL